MADRSNEPSRNGYSLDRRYLEDLIFRTAPLRRYTQDSPILPDVWFEFGERPGERADLLLTPGRDTSPGALFTAVRDRLAAEHRTDRWRERHGRNSARADLAYSQSTVAVRLWFDELVRVILPLSDWKEEGAGGPGVWITLDESKAPEQRDRLVQELQDLERGGSGLGRRSSIVWMIRIVGAIELARTGTPLPAERNDDGALEPLSERNAERVVDAVMSLLEDAPPLAPEHHRLIFRISRNRPASTMVWRSVPAVKADAARRLFDLSCSDLRWAVLDSGVDARHPAFRLRDDDGTLKPHAFADGDRPSNCTRVVATYDFTMIRDLLNPDPIPEDEPREDLRRLRDDPRVKELQVQLEKGRQIDWDLFAPLLEIPHEEATYRPPVHEHGTHVAGILAGDWRVEDDPPPDNDLAGMCPDLPVYDIRVLDETGRGDEFSIIAALQFIRHLNGSKDYVVVHGVNVSLSIPHDVANYACGRTPVCEECERLVGTGVVVVAAAGNEGYMQYATVGGRFAEGYRNISITDPGNTEGVITVGATHRYRPHTYGVSYFSSRGPTGDGRLKPDVVAPGEKIWSSVPGDGVKPFDGTSMAAPHVSGTAALLVSRHRELVGQPERVKQILCKTATDLGRERYFQGSGMVDVLRAIQSV